MTQKANNGTELLVKKFSQVELHLLVPVEIAPLFRHLPWLTRVWAMPRRRGSANLGATLPLLRALRRERFTRSVDFAGNDRGAILSRLIGARQRLGWSQAGGFFGHRPAQNRRRRGDSFRFAERRGFLDYFFLHDHKQNLVAARRTGQCFKGAGM